MSGDANLNPDSWSFWTEVSSHYVSDSLGFVAIVLLGRKIINSLIEILPEKFKFPAKLTDRIVNYISTFYPGWLINITGVVLLITAIFLRFFGHLSSYISSLDKDIMPLLSPDVELIHLLGFLIILVMCVIFLSVSVWNSHRKINKEVSALIEEKNNLVASVEDATRHVLNGLPQIFDRALKLVVQADREIWLINFALNFGKPHCENDAVSKKYKELQITNDYKSIVNSDYRDLNRDAGKFFDELYRKVGGTGIERVYILTLRDESIKAAFLGPLYDRRPYSDKFSGDKSRQKEKEMLVARLANDVSEARGKIQRSMDSRHEDDLTIWGEKKPEGKLYLTDSLPLQLFIAGKTGEDKDGCLVFMVGTEILKGATENSDADKAFETFTERGFYTELPEVVHMYRDIAAALLQQAKKQHEAKKETLPYNKSWQTT